MPLKILPNKKLITFFLALSTTACVTEGDTKKSTDHTTTEIQITTPGMQIKQKESNSIHNIVQRHHRDNKNVDRDIYRKPVKILNFFGIKNTDTVVEILPGAGYYAEILAPFLKDKGQYIATHYPTKENNPTHRTKYRNAFNEKLASNPDTYGTSYQIVDFNIDTKKTNIADNTADFILTFRNLHHFEQSNKLSASFGYFNKILKTGGKLGVVQHRALDKAQPEESAQKGYLSSAYVIAIATLNGFELEKESELLANPKDTKDYEKGVWALPPTLKEGDKNKSKYINIGESDRMTLLFVKK
jgi:predicted methyltransferase